MLVYRVVSRRENAVLNGKGAAKSKVNRWNSQGTEMIYTSQSKELALAEISAYVPVGVLPDPYLMIIEINLPPDQMLVPDGSTYPAEWNRVPPTDKTRLLGDRFIMKADQLAMKVYSRQASSEKGNILINPNHPEFHDRVRVKELIALK